MTRMTGTARVTGRSGLTVMDRVTRTLKVTCWANGKNFPSFH